MASTKTLLIAIVGSLALMQVLGSLLAFGGLGKISNFCARRSNFLSCDVSYSSQWWSVIFQPIVFVLVCVSAMVPSGGKFRIPMLIFLAVSSGLLMQDAEKASRALAVTDLEGFPSLSNVASGLDEARKHAHDGFRSSFGDDDEMSQEAQDMEDGQDMIFGSFTKAAGLADSVVSNVGKSAHRAYLGGLILLTAVNFLLLLLYGCEQRPGVPAVKGWLYGEHDEGEYQEMTRSAGNREGYGDVLYSSQHIVNEGLT